MPRTRIWIVFPTLALPLLVSAPRAHAVWPHDPLVNVPVTTASGDQFGPAVTPDGAGGVIVTWIDFRSATTYDVYAQRLDAAGTPMWSPNGIPIATGVGDQSNPAIASDGSGGAIIVWQDTRGGGAGDIYGQRVNAAGATLWAANGVPICTDANDQQAPGIVADGVGGAVVAWSDARAGSTYDIFAQRVNASGAPQWTANGVALTAQSADQYLAGMVSDGAAGAILVWADYRSGTADLYAQRVSGTGVPQWTPNGVGVCTAPDYQSSAAIATDGQGGALIAWPDPRFGAVNDIYAQRLNASGSPLWTANGVAVCLASGAQNNPSILSDGAGGAFIAWTDVRAGISNIDVYAQRLSAGGLPLWSSDGIAFGAATGAQSYPQLVADGLGGAFIIWQDTRNGSVDVYAQRTTGVGAAQWTANGVALSTAPANQQGPIGVADLANGVIVVWSDYRSANSDLYAQRIERLGYLGAPEPAIASVRDVPNDQGGRMKLSWYASYLDAAPGFLVTGYTIWRSAPPNMVAQALRAGARMVAPGEAVPEDVSQVFSTTTTGSGQIIYWELVGSQIASADSGYSYVVSTTSDSVAGSNPRTLVRVQTQSSGSPGLFWNSAADSGYSVDNLAPAMPTPFLGNYGSDATHLHWGRNHDADLAGYRIYRGTSEGFPIGPATLIAAPTDTGYSDVGPAGGYYKLTAVDIHGNESLVALLTPQLTTDVGEPMSGPALSLAAPRPSPARDRTELHFALPQAGAVSLVLYDVHGRRVRDLADGRFDAGQHALGVELRDRAGAPLGSGIYFVRLTAAGRSCVQRLAVVR